jgi:hypothetical protein
MHAAACAPTLTLIAAMTTLRRWHPNFPQRKGVLMIDSQPQMAFATRSIDIVDRRSNAAWPPRALAWHELRHDKDASA